MAFDLKTILIVAVAILVIIIAVFLAMQFFAKPQPSQLFSSDIGKFNQVDSIDLDYAIATPFLSNVTNTVISSAMYSKLFLDTESTLVVVDKNPPYVFSQYLSRYNDSGRNILCNTVFNVSTQAKTLQDCFFVTNQTYSIQNLLGTANPMNLSYLKTMQVNGRSCDLFEYKITPMQFSTIFVELATATNNTNAVIRHYDPNNGPFNVIACVDKQDGYPESINISSSTAAPSTILAIRETAISPGQAALSDFTIPTIFGFGSKGNYPARCTANSMALNITAFYNIYNAIIYANIEDYNSISNSESFAQSNTSERNFTQYDNYTVIFNTNSPLMNEGHLFDACIGQECHESYCVNQSSIN